MKFGHACGVIKLKASKRSIVPISSLIPPPSSLLLRGIVFANRAAGVVRRLSENPDTSGAWVVENVEE
jgi:hypothetical protein